MTVFHCDIHQFLPAICSQYIHKLITALVYIVQNADFEKNMQIPLDFF